MSESNNHQTTIFAVALAVIAAIAALALAIKCGPKCCKRKKSSITERTPILLADRSQDDATAGAASETTTPSGTISP